MGQTDKGVIRWPLLDKFILLIMTPVKNFPVTFLQIHSMILLMGGDSMKNIL